MGKRSRKRTWKRKSKELRKSNKMWAEGAREDLLRRHIEAYADALERGWRSEHDYLQKVCNEFHSRISWRLADHEEPELPLAEYNPLAPPIAEMLSEEERTARHDRIEDLNKRIRRWLKYRVRSLCHGLTSKASLRENPYAQYMHESYATDIGPVVAERWKNHSVNPDGSANTAAPGAPFRCAIARELFSALPDDEQSALREHAVEEARQAKLKYEKGMKEGPSKSPEARQECIDKIGRFAAPILRGLEDYTGLQAFIVLGGPIPRFNGELGTIHLSVGSNLAVVPTPFPSWDKSRWSRDVVGFYKDYLATAYTAEQRAEAALPNAQSLGDAPYSFNDPEDSDRSDSDSDTESDLDSDSDTESDGGEETDGEGSHKRKKKARAQEKKRKEKEQKKKEKAGVKRKRKEEEKDGAPSTKKSKMAAGPGQKKTPEEEETQRQKDEAKKQEDKVFAFAQVGERRREEVWRRNAKMLEDLDLKNTVSKMALGMKVKVAGPKTVKPRVKERPPVGPPRCSGRRAGGNGTSGEEGGSGGSGTSGEEGAGDGEQLDAHGNEKDEEMPLVPDNDAPHRPDATPVSPAITQGGDEDNKMPDAPPRWIAVPAGTSGNGSVPVPPRPKPKPRYAGSSGADVPRVTVVRNEPYN
ncbi:hypothetical protein B0H13DRAFT_2680676 [Mycena leptocephala]|nr:hypothetical protein B0H13DRAFT_2680676 [Mycena leptocephala]